jgi:hypothetical protein
MKTVPALVLSLFLVPALAMGQQAPPAPPSPEGNNDAPDQQIDYAQIVARFFVQVKAEKYTDAAHIIVDTNPGDAYNVEKHEAVARGLQTISQHFGAFQDFKPLASKNLGEAMGYIYGIGLYERGPILFEFIFFKSGADWRIWRYDFNDNFVDEIRNQAGVHIQSPPTYLTPPVPSPAPASPAAPTPAPAAPPSTNPP